MVTLMKLRGNNSDLGSTEKKRSIKEGPLRYLHVLFVSKPGMFQMLGKQVNQSMDDVPKVFLHQCRIKQ